MHDRSAPRTWWRLSRSQSEELLDTEPVLPADLQGNLADFRWINRTLGSQWLVRTTLHRLWRSAGSPPQWRVLDIGTGAGDIPVGLLRWSQRRGIRLLLVALDKHQEVMRYLGASGACHPSLMLLQADGLQLPFSPKTFDVVVCSTMLHHLSRSEAVALLRSMADAARYGIVVNDLLRSRLHYCGAHLLLRAFSRNHLTRHDGPLSVLRAYSLREVREMARAAGLCGARVRIALGHRMLLVHVCRPNKDRAAQRLRG